MEFNKAKIVNDPVHGFITLPGGIIGKLIEHAYLQRLRNIKQTGLTYLVYPGACHNRLQHALGAMHLMSQAIDVLRSKGHNITREEAEIAMCAILLHDVGHGPFSHALECSIVDNIHHEELSKLIMLQLNIELEGKLDLAIDIFDNNYKKHFLYDLVSSQLDVDRMDYLRRDSFFSGVAEGMIGLERIIKMLDVVNDALVVEAKGIYSIEKFLISRHLMYWQVYLHKTVIAAEQLMVQILRRAKYLSQQGETLFATPALSFFLKNNISLNEFLVPDKGTTPFEHFINLSDSDIESSVKVWAYHADKALSTLCRMIVNRQLFRTELSKTPFDLARIEQIRNSTANSLDIPYNAIDYFVISGEVSNKAYTHDNQSIMIKYNNDNLEDIFNVSDMLSAKAFNEITRKFMLCYPKLNKNE
ncbi:MAG: HD domain-containing protein [Prevotellaceae bacterium]|jgi:HD superfamily phosphohydrolase|nr:HD domain-containing protein [Prevotellaceae bacterium]